MPIQPVVKMVVFSLIFGRLAKLPSEGVPYPIFTLTALLTLAPRRRAEPRRRAV